MNLSLFLFRVLSCFVLFYSVLFSSVEKDVMTAVGGVGVCHVAPLKRDRDVLNKLIKAIKLVLINPIKT